MAPLHPNLKPSVCFKQGYQILYLHPMESTTLGFQAQNGKETPETVYLFFSQEGILLRNS